MSSRDAPLPMASDAGGSQGREERQTNGGEEEALLGMEEE